jgi:hypothetical protein
MSLENLNLARSLILAAATVGIAACSVDPDPPVFGNPDQTASATQGNATTSNGDADDSTSHASDDDDDTTDDPTDPTDPDTTSGDGPPPGCGNGQLDDDEDCDGDLFAVTCEDFGFDGGELSCGPNCNVNTAGCFGCGNGSLEPGEECDGNDFGGETCQSVGDYVGGQLGCTSDCELDLDGCIEPHCGDGILNNDEVCDGNDFGGKSCATEGNFNQGMLQCAADCMSIDTSGCTLCQDQLFGSCANMPCCNGLCVPDDNICLPFGFP